MLDGDGVDALLGDDGEGGPLDSDSFWGYQLFEDDDMMVPEVEEKRSSKDKVRTKSV